MKKWPEGTSDQNIKGKKPGKANVYVGIEDPKGAIRFWLLYHWRI
jgi:hypothetical protein